MWFTFNEPWCSAVLGVPGGTHPYLIAHNILRAHAKTVQLYRSTYMPTQQVRVCLCICV